MHGFMLASCYIFKIVIYWPIILWSVVISEWSVNSQWVVSGCLRGWSVDDQSVVSGWSVSGQGVVSVWSMGCQCVVTGGPLSGQSVVSEWSELIKCFSILHGQQSSLRTSALVFVIASSK